MNRTANQVAIAAFSSGSQPSSRDFQTKRNYVKWCKAHRLPVLRQWALRHLPKLIVCFGKTYLGDFKMAFGERSCTDYQETIAGKDLRWFRTGFGTVGAARPFLVNRHGLNSNASLLAFSERMRDILAADDRSRQASGTTAPIRGMPSHDS